MPGSSRRLDRLIDGRGRHLTPASLRTRIFIPSCSSSIPRVRAPDQVEDLLDLVEVHRPHSSCAPAAVGQQLGAGGGHHHVFSSRTPPNPGT